MKRKIPKSFVKHTKKWLRDDGIKFFREIKEKYGRIDAIWMEGDENEEELKGVAAAVAYARGVPARIPHAVHFREGMQVRNYMRLANDYCKGWDDHDYDDNWVELIEKCIK